MRIVVRLAVTAALVLGLFSVVTLSAASSDAATKAARVKILKKKVLKTARAQKGKWYRRGANGPSSFDCSGYVQYVFKKSIKKKLPRTSNQQLHAGRRIAKSKKRAGDLLIFVRGGRAYHASIYAGKGKIWESQHTGTRVGKHKIWSGGYVVVRVINA